MEKAILKYGKVVIVGRPNTGKSTLINALMNQKVAITSHLPQTTRKSQEVVLANEKGYIVLVDTPGLIGKVPDILAQKVNKEIPRELAKGDLLLMIVDISRPKSDEENKVLGIVRNFKNKKILVYNKIDEAFGPANHLPEYNYLEEEFDKTISISAIKGTHIKGLINLIFEMLPTKIDLKLKKDIESIIAENRPVMGIEAKEYVSEIIREKAYLFLRDEIPYTINVVVDEIKDKKKLIYIKATMFTNADRYKKILIGSNGRKIKQIGFNARKELELMSGRKIYLELTVAVDKHWMEALV